ncbi:hypothetical protein [Brevibacterium otitidis]|uniref:Uncharacterized protein n=1 Tax=Brevibacterium otitidis TaxID=53364 RepID=A0ABV5X5U7_9MICO|nr:hypothetical protein GCM10023233_17540 [Brevibacterium otitidis]
MLTFLAASPSPTDGVRYPDPELVTPGTVGFLVTLALVIATVFLIRDALRRVRRVRGRVHAVEHYPIPLAKEQQRRYQPETHTSKANDSFDTEGDGDQRQ